MSTTLRELIVSVSARTEAYQREMNRASRMGQNYLRTIADGNRQAATAWNSQLSSIKAQGAALESLKGQVTGYAAVMLGALGAGEILRTADNWGQVNARLKQATTGAEDFSAAQAGVLAISKATGTAYEANAGLFARSAASLREYGYDTNDALKVTESLATGLKLSGASAEESSSVITQFSQALAQGVLRGEEFNAVNESGDRVIRALAAGMGVARRDLKAMADAGMLTIDKIMPAMTGQLQTLKAEYAELPKSISGAVQNLETSFQVLIGNTDNATGVTRNLAEAIEFVGNHLEGLAVVGAAAGVGLIAKRAGEAAVAIAGQVQQMRVAQGAAMGSAAAQLDVAAATARRTIAEVRAAEVQVLLTTGTNGQTAALARLRAAKLADLEATRAATAAQAAYTAASSVGARAVGGLMGLLGGPAGLAILAATTAASFLTFSSNAEAANAAAVDLKAPIAELRKEWEALGKAQQRPILASLKKEQREAQQAAAEIVREMQAVAQGPAGDGYAANQYQRTVEASKFGRRLAAGEDIDSVTQEMKAAIGPSEKVSQRIDELAANYQKTVGNSRDAGRQIAELTSLMEGASGTADKLGGSLKTIKGPDQATLNSWEKVVSGLQEKAAKAKDPSELGEVNRKIAADNLEGNDKGKALAERARAAAAAADAAEREKKAAEASAAAAKKATEERTRQAKQLDDNYKRTVAQLREGAALSGQTTELAKVRYATSEGELKTLDAAKKTELERLAIIRDQATAKEAYKSMMEGLQTAEEKLLRQTRERVKVLEAAKGQLSTEEYDKGRKAIADGAFEKAPKYGGMDAAVGGAAGELGKIADAEKELETWHKRQLELLEKNRSERADMMEEWTRKEQEIEQTNQERLASIQNSYKAATLGMFADMTGNVADLMGGMVGQSSAAYKALFAVSKAAAIAQAIVNTEEGATKALAQGGAIMGIPMASIVRATGYASIGLMAGTALAGMAHDGIDNIPKEGTWLLQKGERVVDGRTNSDLKRFLSNTGPAAADSADSGRAPVQVLITINQDGSSQVDTPAGLEQFGTELGQFVDQRYRKNLTRDLQPGGQLWSANNARR